MSSRQSSCFFLSCLESLWSSRILTYTLFFLKLLIINCKFKVTCLFEISLLSFFQMERYCEINCKKYIRSYGNDGNGHVGCGFFQELLVEGLVFFFSYYHVHIDLWA
uniref:Secreted protein n=1 Tax=Strongyloides venezuelensis TaxID=75913 RepID=A0A0K0FZ97_STRVS